MPNHIIINVAGGVVQEVLTNLKDSNIEVILLDQDDEDSEHVSGHFMDTILKDPNWSIVSMVNYKEALMPEQRYGFTIEVFGKGSNPQEAWEDAMSQQDPSDIPSDYPSNYRIIAPHDEGEDILCLMCELCEVEQEGPTDDMMSEWAPECYVGDENIGTVCMPCSQNYCKMDEDGLLEVDLSKVDLTKLPALRRHIEKCFKHNK